MNPLQPPPPALPSDAVPGSLATERITIDLQIESFQIAQPQAGTPEYLACAWDGTQQYVRSGKTRDEAHREVLALYLQQLVVRVREPTIFSPASARVTEYGVRYDTNSLDLLRREEDR